MTNSAAAQHQTFTAADGTKVVYEPRPAGALVQLVIGGQRYGDHFDHPEQALDAYRTLRKEHTAALEVGEQTVDSVGRTSVTVQRVTPWAFAVVTEQGSLRVDSFGRSYETQREANAARDHALTAFARYGTIDAIEARTAELVPELMRLTGRRGPTARRDEKAVSVELYGLATLAEKAQLADIAADLAA